MGRRHAGELSFRRQGAARDHASSKAGELRRPACGPGRRSEGARRPPWARPDQTPPSLAFDETRTGSFLDACRALLEAPIVLEPRHASWFTASADQWLAARQVARVAADPEPAPGAGMPGGTGGLVYFRLHGSPEMYRSAYGRDRLKVVLQEVMAGGEAGAERWVVFDNTASGEAAADALALADMARSA